MSIKIREFQKILKAYGAEPVRQTGNHQMWRLPNGVTVPLALGYGEISRYVAAAFRKEFIKLGWEWPHNA